MDVENMGSPWPMPPPRSQYIFCIMSVWMIVPLAYAALPSALLFSSDLPVWSPTKYLWACSVLFSFLHWGRYVAGGALQKLDVSFAALSGLSLLVETCIYVRQVRLGLILGTLLLSIFLGVVESARPSWDGHNGFLVHCALRFCGCAMVAMLYGQPAEGTSTLAPLWSLIIFGLTFVAHHIAENFLFFRGRRRRPPERERWFYLAGIVRGIFVAALATTLNRLSWEYF